MYYKPVDEMSLRHLFSSCYGENILKMNYIGPVLNPAGDIETSPDCLILDRRNNPFRILRCEFKYAPNNGAEFENNGRFDIAIVWRVAPPLTREILLAELHQNNGCNEVVVLSDFLAFRNLREYDHIPNAEEFDGIDNLIEAILEGQNGLSFPTVSAAFIAAKIFPNSFRLDRMIEFLIERFPEVGAMQPQGVANVVTCLSQLGTPLLIRLRPNFYRWNDNINANLALVKMDQIIRVNYESEPLTDGDINRFRELQVA